MKLFGVYLGGKAEGCHIEAHDFVFAIGNTIEDTYDYLKKGLGLVCLKGYIWTLGLS